MSSHVGEKKSRSVDGALKENHDEKERERSGVDSIVPAPVRKASRRRPRSRFGNSYSVYVPPFRAARQRKAPGELEKEHEQQQAAWTAMKKRINGVINRINASNIRECVARLLRLNIVRGKGIFCKSLMRAQLASSQFSDVYAALISVLNTRVPEVAALLLCRLIIQLKDGYAAREKMVCIASLRFLAHLFNQQVIDALPLLEFISVCLLEPSNDSTELAVLIVRECGHLMSERSPRATEGVFSQMREVLHNNAIDYRTQVLVDGVMELRRKKFRTAASLRPELDLVDEDDIILHSHSLEEVDANDAEENLNSFHFDKSFDENESKYNAIRDIILGDEALPSNPNANLAEGQQISKPGIDVEKESENIILNERNNLRTGKNDRPSSATRPVDLTESSLVDFRRIVYLKIMSAATYEECAHKLLKLMRDNQGMESELCNMVIECCSQEKSFLRYYGLLGQRLCFLSKVYVSRFEDHFARIYATIHRYDTRKIRNIGSFFASLLASDALNLSLMLVVHLVEDETTASSRIFLKILFQELAHTLGENRLIALFKDEDNQKFLTSVFPRDEPKNVRFAINFFTTIGLGYVTDDLREFLKLMPKRTAKEATPSKTAESDESSSLSSSSLSSSSLSLSSGICDREEVPDPEDRPTKKHRSEGIQGK